MIEDKDKEDIKLRFALCLQKAIEDNEMTLRGLAAASGLEYTNVQRASVGEVNIALTTIIALAEGLGISPSKFFLYYEKVNQDEINVLKEDKKRKKKQNKSKGGQSSIDEHAPIADQSLQPGTIHRIQTYLTDFYDKIKKLNDVLVEKANEFLNDASNEQSIDSTKLKEDLFAIGIEKFVSTNKP